MAGQRLGHRLLLWYDVRGLSDHKGPCFMMSGG